jgi:aromatase
MPRIQHTVTINRPPREVFDITNDIEAWPELFNEYTDAKVLTREDDGRFTKLTFQLTNNEGNTWQSWRILDNAFLVVVAEREKPLFPFRYMHLKWTYNPAPDGTVMTWTQDFELDPDCPVPLSTAVQRFEEHASSNQQRIKKVLEAMETGVR